ncbi:hypothetical protein ACJX0J_024929, partial [Zea mays]
ISSLYINCDVGKQCNPWVNKCAAGKQCDIGKQCSLDLEEYVNNNAHSLDLEELCLGGIGKQCATGITLFAEDLGEL